MIGQFKLASADGQNDVDMASPKKHGTESINIRSSVDSLDQ